MNTTPTFPRAPLFAIATVLLFTLGLAAFGRMTDMGAIAPTGSVVASRDLHFADGPNGSVVVTDARDNAPVEVFTGENGFIRGTLRGLARNRRMEGIGPQPPFRLTAWSDGRLTLDDPSTKQHLELQAFGPDNTVLFANLLTAKGTTTKGSTQ